MNRCPERKGDQIVIRKNKESFFFFEKRKKPSLNYQQVEMVKAGRVSKHGNEHWKQKAIKPRLY